MSGFAIGAGSNDTKLPTIQKFTSGSGTYTAPDNVAYIIVKMVGAGGGGGGSGTAAGGAGGTGGTTTFGTSLLSAGGGVGGHEYNNYGALGTGGTSSLGAITTGLALTGGHGENGIWVITGATDLYRPRSGMGGSSVFGGAGANATSGNAGGAGVTNTGGGGGGGSLASATTNAGTGGGGGSGGYVYAVIPNPDSSYAYAVGAGGTAGTAGTSGFAGGAGGSGVIIVEEHYSLRNFSVGSIVSISQPVSVDNTAKEATYGSAAQVVATTTITEGTYLLIWTVVGNMNIRPTAGIGSTGLSIEVNSVELIESKYFTRWYPATNDGDTSAWAQTLTAYAVVPDGETHTINCYLDAISTSGTPTNLSTRSLANTGKLIGIKLK